MKKINYFLTLIAALSMTHLMVADSGRGAFIAGNILGGIGAGLAAPAYYAPYPYYGPPYAPAYYGPYYPYAYPYYDDRDYRGRDRR